MENAEIARLFRELADLLELDQANPFRVRAYRTAARTLETYPDSLSEVAARDPKALTAIPGVGEDLAGKIVEIVKTGRLRALAQATRHVPPEVAKLMSLPGLGPKRVRALYRTLGVRTFAELRGALQKGRVRKLPGFGAKLEEQLRQALAERGEAPSRFLRPVAAQYADALLKYMRSAPGLTRAEWAGSFRRCQETVGDLDLLVTARKAAPVVAHFLAYPESERVLAQGTTRAAIRLRSGLQVDLRVLDPESYGSGLYYFTGSKAHNIAIRRLPHAHGLKVNEYGIWKGKTRIGGRTEEEVARAAGLPLIPPELREDRGELEAARAGRLPRLVTLEEIRGDLHSHTDASDGRATLVEMAHAADERGYAYLAVTDHSPHLKVTRGLDRARLRQQRRAIDRLNSSLKHCRLLAGCEVDILPDGSLDLDDETLWALDIVIVSVHTSLSLPKAAQTRRVLRALSHPAVDILAHPTGRLLGQRAGIALDFEEVARAAAGNGVALEINSQPDRQDLDDLLARSALAQGAKLAIDSDAHAVVELDFVRWGVDQARRGWATAADIINTQPLRALLSGLHAGRAGARPRAAPARQGTRGRARLAARPGAA
ncbi:MAG TPA: DNA polymerase/3'-5' exonuclease PolX [Gemmatimonadales bacterium]|nr:DNA polymerase/3'-5' exonuclease PolX [Gemmatimonadales bacterium]